ncbi:MAG: AAA family ATPase [Planctomycetes bacterium]|nr:AAA family ATPase [Planctomycetota bacterium]
MPTRTLVFPKIKFVELCSFSLYTRKSNIPVKIDDGVFCLAGANGLGKSTFLGALNYALTGVVREHTRSFKSVKEFYNHSIGYSDKFFTGKIVEEDRDAAEIILHLEVGEFLYRLTRGVFEPNELREFTVHDKDSDVVLLDGSEMLPDQRHEEYKKRITENVGLAHFGQFVFLQHFVFTFDESRHLLLWDNNALNQALFLCLGSDYKNAERADQLRREMEKASSLARNYSWRASGIHREINLLQKPLEKPDSEIDLDELEEQHQVLQNELEQLQSKVEEKQNEFNDTHLRWMKMSSELAAFQNAYTQAFERFVDRGSDVELHPLIVEGISEEMCAVCGNQGTSVVEIIKQRISQQQCPLCSSPLSQPEHTAGPELMERLQTIDAQMSEAKKHLANALKAKERISGELNESQKNRSLKFTELEKFETTNEQFLYRLKSKSETEQDIQKKLEEMENFLRLKKRKYAERDQKRKEFLELQRNLETTYTIAQMKFVPTFRDLARLFLGIDLDILMDFSTSVTAPGISLTLEMRDIPRRQEQQLSESQRFFLDIALRMALAEYAVTSPNKATLFIDTPEGSLDIAYESRVGQMFARFVKMRHNIIMTANINSSQILKRLAKECGHSKMALHEMRFWTELSEVQMKETPLFEDALAEIEKAFNLAEDLDHV